MYIEKLFARLSVLLLFTAIAAQAQELDLDSALKQLTGNAAKRYVSPIVSAFGADMNAGWYHKSPSADKFKFSIEGGIVIMGAMMGGGDKRFDVSQSFRLNRKQADSLVGRSGIPPSGARDALRDSLMSRNFNMRLYGATVIGSSTDSIRVIFDPPTINGSDLITEDTLTLPFGGVPGINKIPFLPLPTPQFTIGTVFGTNVTFRYLPTVPLGDEFGEFSYFGFGIQHNPQVWLGGKLPVDVCGSLFMQKLKLGTFMEASTFALGINASKTFGWRILNATPYAGIAVEKSTMSFGYDFPVDVPGSTVPSTQRIKFDLEGDNNSRLTMGLSLRLLVLNINADYNLAKYPSFSIGFMVGY